MRRTAERNVEHVAAERLEVRHCALSDLDTGPGGIGAAFSVNVNVFWTTAAEPELAVLRCSLAPGGLLARRPGRA